MSRKPFLYSKLPEGDYIRILVLERGRNVDPLSCRLQSVSLDRAPSFEAISYVWGKPQFTKRIVCNGRRLRITTNLRNALRQVRLPNKRRLLWADSICINQRDIVEKGHQVSLMGRIYSISKCTLICLGPDDTGHSQTAVRVFKDVDSWIKGQFDQEGVLGKADAFPQLVPCHPIPRDARWKSLGVLLECPWFQRAWVVQEAALGENGRILWGTTQVEWLDFLRVYIWIYLREPQIITDVFRQHLIVLHLWTFQSRKPLEAMTFATGWEDTTPSGFLRILFDAKWLAAYDPRDRIYAFLSLMNTNELLPKVLPDYSKTYMEVYHQFAADYIRTSGPDILSYVENLDDDLARGLSWVPRWDEHIYGNTISHVSQRPILPHYGEDWNYEPREPVKSSLSSLVTISADGNVLRCRGVIFDVVKRAFPRFTTPSTKTDAIVSLWQQVSGMEDTSSIRSPSTEPPNHHDPMSVFLVTLRMGVYSGDLSEFLSYEKSYKYLLQYGDPSRITQKDYSQHDVDIVENYIRRKAVNRKFVTTDRGYYGLSPAIARQGDLCCIIYGTRSPLLIRKTSRESHYQLVGEVYMCSKRKNERGDLRRLGYTEEYQDWLDWDLPEEDICIC